MMETSYMIGKMNAFMHQLAGRMSEWLESRLPRLSDNWWSELVYDNLTNLQREQVDQRHIADLGGLDLAALLRVVDRNWFVITSSWFINNRERTKIKDMMQVRNSWAHIASGDGEISKKKILSDIETIIELMEAFDASMSETRDMEKFAMDVEDDCEMQEEAASMLASAHDDSGDRGKGAPAPAEIAIGSIVALASDPSKQGPVMKACNGRYTVWMGDRAQEFFKDQIQIQPQGDAIGQLAVSCVRTALTAYQINNPGSSSLYSLNAARIDFVPYQFRPALKMIHSDNPRILVADDVGVGKTIEAGLILKEMEARAEVDSVLVICPRPLVAERKWQLEMKRFDEDFVQMDGADLREAILEADRDGEWPDRYKRAVIPYSLFSEDSIEGTESSSSRKKKNKGLSQLDPLPHFDLVIVDEAHNIRNPSTWANRGVELFIRDAGAVAFLTATPLQNSNDDLYTLLNMLRPDVVTDRETFRTMAEPNQYVNALLRVVRSQGDGWQGHAREEISNILGTSWGRNVVQHNPDLERVYDLVEKGELTRDEKIEAMCYIESLHSFNGLITRTRRRDIEDFCVRHTQTVKVPFADGQQEIYDALMEFERRSLTRLHGSRSVRFMMCSIMRQAASCIYGLAPYLNDIVQKRMDQIQEEAMTSDVDFALDYGTEDEIGELADEIERLFENLPSKDPKLEELYEIIEEKQLEENNRVIIFSTYKHTLSYLREHLMEKGYRVGQVDGSVPDEERFKMRERFQMDRDEDEAIDILLFSEVGCEGLDYQFCDMMVNYDLPWNPMRIEQRIGRIDRKGQKSEAVRICNMITEGTIDAVIYDRCLSKIGVFKESIGDCSEILGDISEQISKIVLEPGLSDEEREKKIEEIADNDVRRIQEINRLEQEEKSLYGFDLSGYIQSKDVQDAESAWISPESLSNLVDSFLRDFLGDGEYIRPNKENEIRVMSLSSEKRQKLLKDFSDMKLSDTNTAARQWKAYLKGNRPKLRITYDSATAKDNRDVTFLTQMHPLALQAARHKSELFPCEMGISIGEGGMPAGDYEFLIYAWKYVGLRPDVKFIAISENEDVQENVLSYMQYAEEYAIGDGVHSTKWSAIEELQYDRWRDARDEYVAYAGDDCDYKIEQLRQTMKKREETLRRQIANSTDERIRRMRTAELANLQNRYAEQEEKLEEAVKKADIHSQLLIKGVLHVE